MARWRSNLEGWDAPDEHVEDLHGKPTKLKKSTRSVSVHLTVEACERVLPALEQVEWIKPLTLELDAIPKLASLPNLRGVDVHNVQWHECAIEDRKMTHEEGLRRVVALPGLTSLRTHLTATEFELLQHAKGLRYLWASVLHAQQLTEAQIAHLGGLSELEELKLLWGSSSHEVPALGVAAVQGLVAHGRLRDVHLELNWSNGALDALLGVEGLEKITLKLPDRSGAEHERVVQIRDRAALSRLEVSGRGALRLERLPALKDLSVMGFGDFTLEALPRVGAIELDSAKSLVLRGLAGLRRLRVMFGPGELEVSSVPKLRSVELPENDLTGEGKSALRAALPEARLILEPRRPKKRKRTAPKRALKDKDWKHPRLGFAKMTYAALLVGRRYDGELTLSKLKELGAVAEFWAAEQKQHLAAISPFDLTASGGLSSSDDVTPIVVGKVAALVSADEGPMALELAAIRAHLAAPLPEAFWAEVAGVIGDDTLETTDDAVHLLSTGPLASAMLAFGELKGASAPDVAGGALIGGHRFDQTPHAEGVLGELIDSIGDDASELDLDELPTGQGQLYLIASYD